VPPSPLDRGEKAGINPKDSKEEIRKPDPDAPVSAQVIRR